MIWAAIMAGFVAGLVHVLSGPDHLAAVAPLTVGKGSRSWRTGLQWAFGHCGGVLVIGFLALFFRELLPLNAISSSAEKFVGVLLLGVGAWGICKCFTKVTDFNFVRRTLLSAPDPDVMTPRQTGVSALRAALAIGAVHGMAGSSHLLGVIPGLLFPIPAAVCAYFVGFAAGTIGGMAGFSAALGLLPQRTYRGAMAACSCAAMVLGGYWLIA